MFTLYSVILYNHDQIIVYLRFVFHRDNLSGGADECGGEPLQPPAMIADDVCPWDMAAEGGGDKNKRPLPMSIAEERERRMSTSSSRKNSGGAAYDSAASADESQSDSVASRLRRSCGLGGGGGGGSVDRRRGSSAACTPQQTVDRPSVSSAEDFDIGPSPESRSPEKQLPTSPHEPAGTASLDDKSNRMKLMKSLSLARKQSVTPVINVSSVDRDNGCDRTAEDVTDETAAAVAECVTSTGSTTVPGSGGGHTPEPVASCSGSEAAATTATAAASISDGNDVCPWEDE